MERCLGCGGDVSTASERKRRRLLGSSTAEKIRNTLISFFCQCHNLQLDSESIRRGYICRNCVRLIEKYNLLHEEVATNTRKALPHLPVTAGGTGQVLSIASIIPSTSSRSTSAHMPLTSSSMPVTATYTTTSVPQFCAASPVEQVTFTSEAPSTPSRHTVSATQMSQTALTTTSESPEVTVSIL